MAQSVRESAALSSSVLAGRCYPDGRPMVVQIENGCVAQCEPAGKLGVPHGVERWVVPGFFDLQVNGFAGRGFTDLHVPLEDVQHIARAVLTTGVTRFLPTIVTADLETMCRQLSVIAEAIRRDELVAAMCPGAHVEGPFIHPEDGPRGAHPREHVRPPNASDFDRLYEAAGGRIAIMTLAPDQPGAAELIRHARELGVVVALGHHRAEAEHLESAIRVGAAMTTHLGNGCDAVMAVRQFHRRRPPPAGRDAAMHVAG
jgi:N-acetylglucosamine-6-phosphate deacetylase